MVANHPAFEGNDWFHSNFKSGVIDEGKSFDQGWQEYYKHPDIIKRIMDIAGLKWRQEQGGDYVRHTPSPFYSIVAINAV